MKIDQYMLAGGRLLPLAEDFYTIQGEGFHTGKPAYFVRLAGCDVGCRWCDASYTWNVRKFRNIPIEDIVEKIKESGTEVVVITGGEPTLYPLELLTRALKELGLQVFIETSGTNVLRGEVNWICLSPKPQRPPVSEMLDRADELKVIIERVEDLDWAEKNAALVRTECRLFLQPEWSVHEVITPIIVDYVKKHPKWSISLQTHKFIDIP